MYQGNSGLEIVAKDETRDVQEHSPVSEEMRVVFGKNCKAARVKKGLSQDAVAAQTGIPQPRIAQIELGRVNITLETMIRIAQVVDHDLKHLLTAPSESTD